MIRSFVFTLLFATSLSAFSADGDRTWFFQSFTDVSYTITTDMNVRNGLSELCRKKSNSDLRNLTEPDYSADDSAFGHTIGDFVDLIQSSDTMVQCQYNSGPELNENIYYLYIFAESACDEGSTFDREQRSCVVPDCVKGETVLLAGISSSLVQTSPNVAYIADHTPSTACYSSSTPAKGCTYNKPSYSHSCYSDSPLSWDGSGNMSGSATGHCNYQFVNGGSSCSVTASNSLPSGFGGYSLTSTLSDEFTCAEGITSPGCPSDSNGDGSGSDSGSGSGGSGGSGSGSGSGDNGSGGDTGSGDTGSGGSGTGSSGSVSGTACDAALSCSGDAIQCAILAQQKKSSCALANLNNRDEAAVASLLSGEKFELEEKTIQASSLFERARFLPEACPAPMVMYLSYGTYDLSFDLICEYANTFSGLLILSATLFALMILFKE